MKRPYLKGTKDDSEITSSTDHVIGDGGGGSNGICSGNQEI